MWGWRQRDGDDSRTRLAGHSGGSGGIIRCSTRSTQRYDAASSNRAIFELDRRGWYNLRNLLFMNVVSQITKFVLDFSKMVVNALIVTLSVVLYAI